jgi:phosphotriesterase-related protein
VLRAAVAASFATGATIGSHTMNGAVARAQLDIIERAGGSPDRFVWIHAHAEPDRAIHLELARRGCWVEFDGIGDPAQDQDFVDMTRDLLDAGFSDSVLLSQDRGWFDPAQPRGGTPLPYTALFALHPVARRSWCGRGHHHHLDPPQPFPRLRPIAPDIREPLPT